MALGEVPSSAWQALRLPQVQSRSRPVSRRRAPRGDLFLRGPVPLPWLGRACELPGGKPLAVALAIWYLSGLRKSKENLRLGSDTLRHFNVTGRSAKKKALLQLERAGLIRVERRQGKNPLVSIVKVGADSSVTTGPNRFRDSIHRDTA
jgi:hypothetical protein